MFSRKPKERKVPEVNVLPAPALVPQVLGAPSSRAVPQGEATSPVEDTPRPEQAVSMGQLLAPPGIHLARTSYSQPIAGSRICFVDKRKSWVLCNIP